MRRLWPHHPGHLSRHVLEQPPLTGATRHAHTPRSFWPPGRSLDHPYRLNPEPSEHAGARRDHAGHDAGGIGEGRGLTERSSLGASAADRRLRRHTVPAQRPHLRYLSTGREHREGGGMGVPGAGRRPALPAYVPWSWGCFRRDVLDDVPPWSAQLSSASLGSTGSTVAAWTTASTSAAGATRSWLGNVLSSRQRRWASGSSPAMARPKPESHTAYW